MLMVIIKEEMIMINTVDLNQNCHGDDYEEENDFGLIEETEKTRRLVVNTFYSAQ